MASQRIGTLNVHRSEAACSRAALWATCFLNVLVLTETGTPQGQSYATLATRLPRHHLWYGSRPSCSGGVLVAISPGLSCDLILSEPDIVIARVNCQYVIGAYIPPLSPSFGAEQELNYLERLSLHLTQLRTCHPSMAVLVIGDLNLSSRPRRQMLEDISHRLSLRLTQPSVRTHRSGTTPDGYMTNMCGATHQVADEFLSVSDHCLLQVTWPQSYKLLHHARRNPRYLLAADDPAWKSLTDQLLLYRTTSSNMVIKRANRMYSKQLLAPAAPVSFTTDQLSESQVQSRMAHLMLHQQPSLKAQWDTLFRIAGDRRAPQASQAPDLSFSTEQWTEFIQMKFAGPTEEDTPCLVMLTTPCNYQLALNAIRALKATSCNGPDSIPPAFYKRLANSPMLVTAIAETYSRNSFTADMFDAKVVPLKKPNRGDAQEAYRLLVVGNAIGRVFRHMLRLELTHCARLHACQFGFQHAVQTSHHLITLLCEIEAARAGGAPIFIAAMDQSSAYDCVRHDLLIDRMVEDNIPDFLRCRVMRFIELTHMRYRNGRQFRQSRGTPQGAPESPILFNVYVNRIIERAYEHFRKEGPNACTAAFPELPRYFLLFYADDIVIVAYTIEMLNRVAAWLDSEVSALHLAFNPSKTVFCGPPNTSFRFQACDIPASPDCKILGVIFSRNHRWHQHRTMALAKASRGFFSCLNHGVLDSSIPPLLSKRLLVACVLAPLEYAVGIWGEPTFPASTGSARSTHSLPVAFNSYDRVIRKVCGSVLQVHGSQLSLAAMATLLKIPPFRARALLYKLRLITSIRQLPCDHPAQISLTKLRSINSSWYRHFAHLAQDAGLVPLDAFLNPPAAHPVCHAYAERLWLQLIDSQSSLRLLRSCNVKYEMAGFLFTSDASYRRAALLALADRMPGSGSHQGRFADIPYALRFCPACLEKRNEHVVDDAKHVLTSCCRHETLLDQLMIDAQPFLSPRAPNPDQLFCILTQTCGRLEPRLAAIVARYVRSIWRSRLFSSTIVTLP